ncbi:polyketide synthase dehydratase domain-containing protein [Streptomyces sp. M19]
MAPAEAKQLTVDGFYEQLTESGYGYGPAFQGLRAAWRHGEELYAEVAVPEELQDDAARFGLHPALLDASLHALLLDSPGQLRLPFSWSGVALSASGASTLRVRITPRGQDGVTLALADAVGQPVATVEAMEARPVSAEQLAASGGGRPHDALHHVIWTAVQPGRGRHVHRRLGGPHRPRRRAARRRPRHPRLREPGGPGGSGGPGGPGGFR